MSYITSTFRHPQSPVNDLGLSISDYEGALSTLCAGCGHDSVSAALIQACFELSLPPHKMAKISGIGCSSKTPTYFMSRSHGFNSVHGRMPTVATGANLANKDLIYIGISGDGDSASIGIGQFMHGVRRNINMLYVVENNGCYGLTKGQDSATADVGSVSKSGVANDYAPIDLCRVAVQLGAGFVGRSFSGDKDQLVPMLKGAIQFNGFAFIDVISPCVTFNNNDGSSKSYDFVRERAEVVGALDYIEPKEEITARQQKGKVCEVPMHDGSILRMCSVGKSYDPTDRSKAFMRLQEASERDEILTGLLYVNPDSKDIHQLLHTDERAFNTLDTKDLCPGSKVLDKVNKSLR